MSDVRVAKRKAEELEVVPETEQEAAKKWVISYELSSFDNAGAGRVKTDDKDTTNGANNNADAAGGSDDEEDVDNGTILAITWACEGFIDVAEELAALDAANVIEGGRRTRGVRIDYTKLKVDEDDEEDDEEEDGQEELKVTVEDDEEEQADEADEEAAQDADTVEKTNGDTQEEEDEAEE
ncbi:hypothetical protein K439DRAFT_1610963 [Ramaria rubella]|nr:hypothetical protein K439DRAFT_1610963 [Ramaria rubella]